MKKLRAAVIGVGYLGNFHAQKYKKLSEEKWNGQIELSMVCDFNLEQAQKVGASLAVPSTQNFKDLAGRVDAVTIATNSPLHFEIAKWCLENRIHVNVEKPMSMNSVETAELLRIAKVNGLVLTVGHSERFAPGYAWWKSHLASFRTLEFERHAPYKARGADVSVLHDLLVHDLDLALSLFPQELPTIKSISAGKVVSPTLDWATCLLQWSNGKTAWISASRVSATMLRRCRGLGESGLFSFDFQSGQAEHASFKNSEWTAEVLPNGKADNLLLETDVFIGAILGKNSLEVTAEDGHRALSMIGQLEVALQRELGPELSR